MVSFQLKAVSPLNGYHQSFEQVSLREVTNLSIVSMALALGESTALQSAMQHHYQGNLAKPGVSIVCKNSADQAIEFWSMSTDQSFVFSANIPQAGELSLLEQLQQSLGECCYLSEQSDAWVALRLEGKQSRCALERICPIDLHPNKFTVGDVARTSMEHLSVLIRKESADSYLLLSPRSSSTSFLHALEVSILNTQ